jgi:hypothetical protein
MLKQIEVLTSRECEDAVAAIHRLRQFWIPRKPEPCSFFTLGSASYLDCPDADNAEKAYYNRANFLNHVLTSNFDWLYQRLRSALAEQLGSAVSFREGFALPGFHIWLTAAICTAPVASVHFDLQYRHLRWAAKEQADFNETISFTLPLRLPKAGGGLNVWCLEYQEFLDARERGFVETIPEIQRFKTKIVEEYLVGRLALHSGHLLHQIAPVSRVEDGDERVTLQGHGVLCRGKWSLYW